MNVILKSSHRFQISYGFKHFVLSPEIFEKVSSKNCVIQSLINPRSNFVSSAFTKQRNSLSKESKEFLEEELDFVEVYVDGSCLVRKGISAGGAGVYWGDGDSRNTAYPLPSVYDERGNFRKATSQKAELTAAIMAVKQAKQSDIRKLLVKTDSQLVVKGMTSWIQVWMKNNWKTKEGHDVINRIDFLRLWILCRGLDISWEHVKGHEGIFGNERAHELANEGAHLAIRDMSKSAEEN